jgi:hypothetical protein
MRRKFLCPSPEVIAMKRHSCAPGRFGAVAAGVLLTFGLATAQSLVPAEQHEAGVSYRAGGVGEAESAAMKAEAANYPLALLFTARIGGRQAYLAAVKVHIAKADGATVLDSWCDGPYLLVNLPAGDYRITALHGPESRTQIVRIAADGHRQLVFESGTL